MKYVLLLTLLAGCGEIQEIINDWEEANEAIIDVVDPTDSPTTTVSTTTTTILPDATNPICNKIYGADGPGGFLWKPISESNGKLAVQLPGVFATKFDACHVEGTFAYGPLFFNGFHNWDGQDKHKRDRQLWRGQLPGGSYGGSARVVCSQSTQECTWQVDNANIRTD